MKKILIALDDSPIAQKVAKAGCQMAMAIDARAILLHVVSDRPYYTSLDYSPVMGFEGFNNAVETVAWEEWRKVASNYLKKIKELLGSPNIETLVKQGEFANTILETAKDQKVEMIVMGTHSRRGLEKILVGSVAEKVLQRSLIPLFIVPAKS